MKSIDPKDLRDIAQDAQNQGIDVRIDLIYAAATHLLNGTFKQAIYAPHAKLWLHTMLADVVLLAAKNANAQGLRFVITDGLRTTDAQTRMLETPIVRANPHWIVDGPKALLSKPGGGGHPRGMAVDILLETKDGVTLNMGTPLDYFSTDPDDNPAARNYPGFAADVMRNRATLENLMMDAAKQLNTPLLPLPSEWWDFRLPPEIFNAYAPLADADLPDAMRMCS